jgi:drug/metabolite transporter (DMT)-like permease
VSAPSRSRIILAFAAVYIIWGSTYLTILLAIRSIPPFLMAGTRFIISGFIMYGLARWFGAPRPAIGTWKNAIIIGGCLLLGGNGGVTLSEKWIPTGLAALLVATVPIYIALLGWLTGKSPRPTLIMWLGLIGGFIGVGVLAAPAFGAPAEAGHNYFGLGVTVLLVGSLMWSIGSLYSRHASSASSLFVASGQQMISGGVLLFVTGSLLGEMKTFSVSHLTPSSIAAFVYLVLIGALIGYTAYFFLLRHCEPAKVATYAYVNPIVAIILGRLFLHEPLTIRTLVGAGLIIGSVAIVITGQQFRARKITERHLSNSAPALTCPRL